MIEAGPEAVDGCPLVSGKAWFATAQFVKHELDTRNAMLAPAEAAKPRNVVTAEVHSDDRAAEADFEATSWFEQASDDEILALARVGWRGDYPADVVAEHYEDDDDDVRAVFEYVRLRRNHTGEMGFECSVDEDEAMAWLEANRPALAETIKKEML